MTKEFDKIFAVVMLASLTVALLFSLFSLLIWHFLGEPNYYIRNRSESDLWIYGALQLVAGFVFSLFASVAVYVMLQFTARSLCLRSFYSNVVLICSLSGFLHSLVEQTLKSFSTLSFCLYFFELLLAFVATAWIRSTSNT